MSETRGEYLPKPAAPVTCRSCGVTLGHEVDCNGLILFRLDKSVHSLRNINGLCGLCGEPFAWHASDRQLQQLLGHVLQMRRDGL